MPSTEVYRKSLEGDQKGDSAREAFPSGSTEIYRKSYEGDMKPDTSPIISSRSTISGEMKLKGEDETDAAGKDKVIIGTLMKADALTGSVVGNKIAFYLGAIPGMALGAAGGSVIGVFGGSVVMPIGKPLTAVALKVVPGSYTNTKNAGGVVDRTFLAEEKAESPAEEVSIFSFEGEDFNLKLQALLVEGSSCGSQGAIFGAEVGGAMTGVLAAVPGMLVGGLVGGIYGLIHDVADYVKYHNEKYKTADSSDSWGYKNN
mmetsp:Transcript_113188/g.205894  ORF Transcript_113188/g.205894 Transcript_113188/m.205894 type:complete len:259 (+) Transcript_113188:64-840(+)